MKLKDCNESYYPIIRWLKFNWYSIDIWNKNIISKSIKLKVKLKSYTVSKEYSNYWFCVSFLICFLTQNYFSFRRLKKKTKKCLKCLAIGSGFGLNSENKYFCFVWKKVWFAFQTDLRPDFSTIRASLALMSEIEVFFIIS